MRAILIAATFVLAACQPQTAEEARAQASEELGQDDPSAPFTPAPVGPPRTYEAYSKTAMSFTPGVLTLTPAPQKTGNLPPGAVFAFGNGIIYETTSMPGGATQGTPRFDWSVVLMNPDGAVDPAEIEMYSVDKETIPPGTPNGGLCAKTSFLAAYTVRSPGAEDLTIAAFQGDVWPPAGESALCGTFTYASVH